MSSELQQTLARSASVSGTSLHTGEKVTLKLQPAPVDSGIKFKRRDLQDEPTIDATIANLKTVERAQRRGKRAALRRADQESRDREPGRAAPCVRRPRTDPRRDQERIAARG